jgi:hypothetical protein
MTQHNQLSLSRWITLISVCAFFSVCFVIGLVGMVGWLLK